MDKSQETREDSQEIEVNAITEESNQNLGNVVKKFGTITVIISVLVIAITAYYYWDKQRTEEASDSATKALYKVMAFMDASEYDKALNGGANTNGEQVIGLVKISSEFSSLPQGQLAAMYAGNAYLSKNDYNKAIEYFEKAQNADSKEVKMGAYAGKGAALEGLNKAEEAAQSYEKAAELTTQDMIKSRYLLYAGLNYENLKQTEKAVEIYKTVLNLNKFSEFAGMAKSGLIRLGTKID